jgi:membrane protein YdbS with pleckstrin-like domain
MNQEQVDASKEPSPEGIDAAGAGAVPVTQGDAHQESVVGATTHGTRPAGVLVSSDPVGLAKEPDAPFQHETFQQVAVDFVTAERFAAKIAVGILMGGGLIAFLGWAVGLVTTHSIGWYWGLWTSCLIGFAAIIALLGWFLHTWPALEHRHLSWRLNAVGLEIQKGVWWQHRITVPRDRVQHVDVEQGPLMRRYGLAKVIVHTAGTHAPTIELPGLSMVVAQDLKTQLTKSAHGSHG